MKTLYLLALSALLAGVVPVPTKAQTFGCSASASFDPGSYELTLSGEMTDPSGSWDMEIFVTTFDPSGGVIGYGSAEGYNDISWSTSFVVDVAGEYSVETDCSYLLPANWAYYGSAYDGIWAYPPPGGLAFAGRHGTGQRGPASPVAAIGALEGPSTAPARDACVDTRRLWLSYATLS